MVVVVSGELAVLGALSYTAQPQQWYLEQIETHLHKLLLCNGYIVTSLCKQMPQGSGFNSLPYTLLWCTLIKLPLNS